MKIWICLDFKKDATYEVIRDYVKEQTGYKVSTLYIARVKARLAEKTEIEKQSQGQSGLKEGRIEKNKLHEHIIGLLWLGGVLFY